MTSSRSNSSAQYGVSFWVGIGVMGFVLVMTTSWVLTESYVCGAVVGLLGTLGLSRIIFEELRIRRMVRDMIYWRCQDCDYDLRGQQHPRCPECGSRIPKQIFEVLVKDQSSA